MEPFELDPKTSALIVIDLQRGIVAREVAPHSSAEVVAAARRLARRFRELKSTVVLVRVAWSADERDRLQPTIDAAMPVGTVPPDFADLVPELDIAPSDLIITKHHWGAFYGTELELQLRRRGVRTIVLCGISTNFGVESTARNAFEFGYDQVFVEDAMAGMSAEAHAFPVKYIFPRLGRVRSTEQVLAALSH